MTTGTWQEQRLSHIDLGVDLFTFRAHQPGPRVAVLGGVHGDEVLGAMAAGQLTLDPAPITRGELRVVPLAHEAAFPHRRNSRIDGINLARTFPGSIDGSPTERLAALLTSEVIARSEYVIDLHTSSWELGTDMPVLAGGLDDGTRYGDRCREMAIAFGAPVTWLHPTIGPGRSLTAAQAHAVPAIYIECPDGGRLNPDHLRTYRDGVRRVLEHLGSLPPTSPAADTSTDTIRGQEIEITAPLDGLFQPSVDLLDEVQEGQEIGVVFNRRGAQIASIPAPVDATVLVLRRRAPIVRGDRLLGLVVRDAQGSGRGELDPSGSRT